MTKPKGFWTKQPKRDLLQGAEIYPEIKYYDDDGEKLVPPSRSLFLTWTSELIVLDYERDKIKKLIQYADTLKENLVWLRDGDKPRRKKVSRKAKKKSKTKR